MDIFELRSPELTRRDFIKVAGAALALLGLNPVSYTHLTLPTN